MSNPIPASEADTALALILSGNLPLITEAALVAWRDDPRRELRRQAQFIDIHSYVDLRHGCLLEVQDMLRKQLPASIITLLKDVQEAIQKTETRTMLLQAAVSCLVGYRDLTSAEHTLMSQNIQCVDNLLSAIWHYEGHIDIGRAYHFLLHIEQGANIASTLCEGREDCEGDDYFPVEFFRSFPDGTTTISSAWSKMSIQGL